MSRRQEAWVAKLIDGVAVAGSGAFDRPGDVREKTFLVEAKSTADQSFRVTLDAIEKLTAEADAENLSPLLALRFETAPAGVERDWFAVPARVFIAMYRQFVPAGMPMATSPPNAK